MHLDEVLVEEFMQRVAGDVGAALHASTVVIGDKLGLYRSLTELGPTDAGSLAAAAACDARLVEEWLNAQFVAGYCQYSARTGVYWLSPEQAAVLADRNSPAYMVGGMTVAVAAAKDEDKVREAFRSGVGLAWHEHHHDLFHGIELMSRPGYTTHLAAHWIPTLAGVEPKLAAGGSIADVGCGHGAASILLAQAYPAATIRAFDSHRGSIDIARKRAAEAGVSDRVQFEVAGAHEFGGDGYDLVCVLDALHEMGDPLAAARRIRAALADDGAWLLVEPMFGASPGDAGGAVGRIFYAVSTSVCTPGAQAQPGGYALGGQVPDHTLAEIAAAAGFTRFRRAAATALNRVFEARP